RDLVEAAVLLVKDGEKQRVATEADARATERLLDLLIPAPSPRAWSGETQSEEPDEDAERRKRTRDKMRARLDAGDLEDREVEVTLPGRVMAPVSILGAGNMEQMEMELQSVFDKIMPKPSRSRRMSVREARPILIAQETEALIDPEKVHQSAVNLAEET